MKIKKLLATILAIAMMAAVGTALAACGETAVLTEIAVDCPKTAYEEGDTFDTTGMKVTATYADGATKEVTGWKILLKKTEMAADYKLKKTDTRITVEYTEGEVTVSKNVTITVAGDYVLTVENATIDGKTELGLRKGAKLNADAAVVLEPGVIGWQDDEGNFYDDYAALAASFAMPGKDAKIMAVKGDNFTKPFTPSCSYKKITSYKEPDENGIVKVNYDNGSQVNVAFEHVLIADGIWGTRYVLNEKTDIGILNGVDEGHTNDGEHEGMSNECPFSDTVEKMIFMTFKNNGDEAITFKYGCECFGIRGQVEVTLAAGETKSAYLKQLKAPAGNSGSVCFHMISLVDGGDSGYDLTIYGFLAA